MNRNDLDSTIGDLGNAAKAVDLVAMEMNGNSEHYRIVRFMADLLEMYYRRLEAAADLVAPASPGPRLVDKEGAS